MNGDLKVGDVVEGSFGKMRIVEDFLPRPEELVLRSPKPATRKVTLVLDDFTIQAFKEKAQELGGSYQAMMRKLLFEYARTLENERSEHAV